MDYGQEMLYLYENARLSFGVTTSKSAAICPASGMSLKTSLLFKIV
jgi:hypothetical protein